MADLLAQFRRDWCRYLFQFAALLGLSAFIARPTAARVRAYIPGFILVYGLSLAALAIGAWDVVQRYNVEPPFIPLVLGAAVANSINLPRGLAQAFQAEFCIKAGIVLAGAALPVSLVVWAEPIAVAQAAVLGIVAFTIIYRIALFLELDRKLAALLAAGGSICGVSSVIVIAGAIRARREDVAIAVVATALWSAVLVVVLPLLARAWYLPAGVGGAWIGASEITDAGGFVAAQTYAAFARTGVVAGTPEDALRAYTLFKVLGSDLLIGVLTVILTFAAMTRWDNLPDARRRWLTGRELWRRLPKFILGFFGASLLVSAASRGLSYDALEATVRPGLMMPLANLRMWLFSFGFLCIGLTARPGFFAPKGGHAFIAFATGVLVNLVVGFVLTAVVFPGFWSGLTP